MVNRARFVGLTLCVTALVAGPPAHAAVMMSDFDTTTHYGGVGGWFNYDSMPVAATVTSPTGGTGTWLEYGPHQYYSKLTAQSWATPNVSVADWNANDQIEFDVIFRGSGANAWLANSPVTVKFEMQTTGGTLGTVNKYPSTSVDPTAKDQIIHVVVDYSSFKPFDATATGWNLSLSEFQPGWAWEWESLQNNPNAIPYAASAYIDNTQFTNVPEPASIGLLTMGALLGLRRRRA